MPLQWHRGGLGGSPGVPLRLLHKLYELHIHGPVSLLLLRLFLLKRHDLFQFVPELFLHEPSQLRGALPTAHFGVLALAESALRGCGGVLVHRHGHFPTRGAVPFPFAAEIGRQPLHFLQQVIPVGVALLHHNGNDIVIAVIVAVIVAVFYLLFAGPVL